MLVELLFEGWGLALPIVSLAIGGFFGALVTIAFGLNNDYNPPSWIVTLIVGCLMIWFVGKKLNTGWLPFGLSDRWGHKHKLLFIPVQYWAFPIALIGAWVIYNH